MNETWHVTWQWSPVVAEQEGDHLDSMLIQSMMAYVQNFPVRQHLYQRLQSQEIPWIEQVLQQHHLPTTGELTPASFWAAEFLARHLRAMALAILTNQRDPLEQELQWGEIETTLDLGSLLLDLVAVMQGQCSEDEQEVAQPLWDWVRDWVRHSTSDSPEPEVGIPDTTAGLPTLMEMFV